MMQTDNGMRDPWQSGRDCQAYYGRDAFDPQNTAGNRGNNSPRNRKTPGFGFGFLAGAAAALVVVLIVGGIFLSRFLKLNSAGISLGTSSLASLMDTDNLQKRMQELGAYIDTLYMGDIDGNAMEDEILRGMVSSLDDPYSEYYSAEEMKLLESSMTGQYVGIGIEIWENADGIYTIEGVIEGGPADQAGIRAGDMLMYIGEHDTTGASLAKMRSWLGSEAGDESLVTVYRPETDEVLEFTVVCDVIEVNTVEYELREDGIGYLALSDFDDISVSQMQSALEDMKQRGMKGLILDLRNNLGGSLASVTGISDLFLDGGNIFYVQDKNGVRTDYDAEAGCLWDGPTEVLVNGYTASAAEVLTGTLRDHGLATVVGTQTYGKGIMQGIYNLSGGAGLKLTIAHYFTPNGEDIHDVGITPDIVVEEEAGSGDGTGEGTSEEADVQYERALSDLQAKLSAAAAA